MLLYGPRELIAGGVPRTQHDEGFRLHQMILVFAAHHCRLQHRFMSDHGGFHFGGGWVTVGPLADVQRGGVYYDRTVNAFVIADSGETGLRSGDVTFRYTRTEPLPKQFTFAATGALSAPTSFYSQKASLITAPATAAAAPTMAPRGASEAEERGGGWRRWR